MCWMEGLMWWEACVSVSYRKDGLLQSQAVQPVDSSWRHGIWQGNFPHAQKGP